jgi:hypothetical protein
MRLSMIREAKQMWLIRRAGTIAALAVTILAASAHAAEVIRSASATKAELTQTALGSEAVDLS